MYFHYKNISLIDEKLVAATSKQLIDYITHLNDVALSENYESDEASVNLPFDDKLFAQILEIKVKKISSKLKYFVLIGIGGSNLGTKAIYDALLGYYDILTPSRYPKMIFLDTQDDIVLEKTTKLINSLTDKNEILVNAISKSGSTTETAVNLEVIYNALENKFKDIGDRFVITTEDGSKMQQAAQEKKMTVLNLPKKVGGRFSVFSAVGLFPLVCLGFNIENLRQGARNMRDVCLRKTDKDNPAINSAVVLYLNYTRGKNINDNFFFNPELESLGKWYRQLLGESIGKDGKGITPTVSIGSTDLHSVGQLYLGGPKDKITTFIYSQKTKHQTFIPQNTSFKLINVIEGKQVSEIMKAIIEGVKIAYHKQHLPFMEVVLDTVSEEHIAEFMQFKMMETMYLGQLMKVNAFDQPQVELYKIETKNLLA